MSTTVFNMFLSCVKQTFLVSGLIFCCLLLVSQLQLDWKQNQPKPVLKTYKSDNRIWISMGLCFDHAAQILGMLLCPAAMVLI